MRSGYEYQIRDDLTARDIAFGYESEVLEYTSTVRGGVCRDCGSKKIGKLRKYTPDFVIPRAQGKLIVEAKGRLTSTDRSKMRDVKREHPELDIRFMFQNRSLKEQVAVATWCTKFNFLYAFGTEIPDSWIC